MTTNKNIKKTNNRQVDEQLVAMFQQGKKHEAFNKIYLKYYDKLYALTSRFIRDSHEAEDCVQEAFIKVYRGLDKFLGKSALYTWMYRITCNTAKNKLTANIRKVHEGVDPMEAENFLAANFLQDVSNPESEKVTDELADLISNAIRYLPEELKLAITLREFFGMSYEEIAQEMDCPIGTVRSRIFRARHALDKVIKTAY